MKFSIQDLYGWYRNTIRNPKYRGWIILGTLAYIVSPIDISPDVFPIAGQIDDVVIIALLITEVSQLLIEQARNKGRATSDQSQTGNTSPVDGVEVIDVDATTVD